MKQGINYQKTVTEDSKIISNSNFSTRYNNNNQQLQPIGKLKRNEKSSIHLISIDKKNEATQGKP